MMRFVYFFNYAGGVTKADGEEWYLGAHASQVRELPGVRRHLSWKALALPEDLKTPGSKRGLSVADQFVRKSDLHFDDLETGLKAVTGKPELWTPSKAGVPGFGDFECMFLDEEPQYDLLRDIPGEQYKYISMPIVWLKGEPPAFPEWLEDSDDDLLVNHSFFNYRKDVSIRDGEDWVLGHHNREGKQVPGVKVYSTWRRMRVPDEYNAVLNLNKWYRLQERGYTRWDSWRVLQKGENGVKMTLPPQGDIFGDYGCIVIRPKEAENLL